MKTNWKLYGLSICWVTIIPCYYDWLRYFRALRNHFSRKTSFIKYQTIWYRFRCLFDTHLTPL
jgi:hypothetical protein